MVNVELLDMVQTRFYNPSVVRSYANENTIDAELVQSHINELQNRFADTLKEQAVRSSFLYNQSADDIYERSRIFGILMESTGGLQSVQFVDTNGLRIHFSTSARDIINRSRDSTSYRNYNEDPMALPYETVNVPDGSAAKYIMDEISERIIFSYPFYDSMDVYRGTALFNIAVRALAERLIAEGRLKVSDDVSVIGEPPGIVLGSPETSRADIHEKVAEIWSKGLQERVVLDSGDSGVNYSLISFRTNNGVFFGRLVHDYLFSISEPMKLILNLCMFLTFYLTLFFMINLKPNPATVVRNRLKRLKDSLFEQLYVNKSSQDRAKWILELEQRRDEIRSELKYNLKLNNRLTKIIDGIIDKSWDELLAVIKVGSGSVIVQTRAAVTTEPSARQVDDVEELDEIEEVEEVEEVDEAEEIEEVDEIEEVSGLDEIDEIEEVEEIDEVEEIEEVNIIDVALREALTEPVEERRGLLGLAMRINKKGKGLLKLATEKKVKISVKPKGKGLLALASKFKPVVLSRKGIAAAATDIEFNYPIMDQETEEILTKIDVVSPFSSMFSSLDNVSMDE